MKLQLSWCRFAHIATIRICVRSQWSRIKNLIWKITKNRALKHIKLDNFFKNFGFRSGAPIIEMDANLCQVTMIQN